MFISSTRSAVCLIDLVWNHKDSHWDCMLWKRRCLTSEPHSLQCNNLWANYQKHNKNVKIQSQGMNTEKWALLHWNFRAVRRTPAQASSPFTMTAPHPLRLWQEHLSFFQFLKVETFLKERGESLWWLPSLWTQEKPFFNVFLRCFLSCFFSHIFDLFSHPSLLFPILLCRMSIHCETLG